MPSRLGFTFITYFSSGNDVDSKEIKCSDWMSLYPDDSYVPDESKRRQVAEKREGEGNNERDANVADPHRL